jgi:hypothetical protein
MVLGARFRFAFAFRAIATASFKPWQQRQPVLCLLTIARLSLLNLVKLPRSRLLGLNNFWLTRHPPAIRRWGHPEFSQIALRI